MVKPRKMLSDLNASYIRSIIKLVETQSKITLVNWCLCFASEHLLPLYEKHFTDDHRPETAIKAAGDWMAGSIKLAQARVSILLCHEAAREAEGNPVAQAAARAIGQCASSIHSARHCLGLPLYGALAIAYDRIGVCEPWEQLEQQVAQACSQMETALAARAVHNEPNPAKINRKC